MRIGHFNIRECDKGTARKDRANVILFFGITAEDPTSVA